MSELLDFDIAQQRLLDLAHPLPNELLPTSDCLGRYLRAPLAARRAQPAADLSAMDGYALAAGDAGTWRIVGESAAGRPYQGALEPGEAVRISTGALMPGGALRVLVQEEAIVEGNRLALAPGGEASERHVRRRGFDFAANDVVLGKGVRLGPTQLALAIAAGFGAGRLTVGRLPSVAIIDSGSELSDGAAPLTDAQVPASNGAMLAAMAAPLASKVNRIGPVPDNMAALADALDAASGADVIVTSGGASVGDHDLLRPALAEWGATIEFWKIAMRPGKPLLLARRKEQIVIGLPGNPVSSFVTAFHFMLPLLRRLSGAADPLPHTMRLPLASDLPEAGPRTEFMRATLGADGVRPILQRDSSALRSLALADGLIRRDAHAPAATAGELATVYWLQNGGTA
ncbi:molybdopterin molybdenumtransferase MoeA [Erythrobacter arachoides]|uniref:Molybdopterin molybdenumtransferase n=1 Tax=Aurantiacibacter arachoides TaxID=1850444 RepID=A0A844ZYX4_9SPHN|nr:molybdopterin molybdotransferase MoeA [Aurantiacibacter arachoides]MXO93095.1 molybdopterin molybdenumtransferase MoeA [Aurantiacibacter arachoides]GGD52083.1 molybdopterin molybdenumtransferase MoeA [Aurantiacibacter arachoides]